MIIGFSFTFCILFTIAFVLFANVAGGKSKPFKSTIAPISPECLEYIKSVNEREANESKN